MKLSVDDMKFSSHEVTSGKFPLEGGGGGGFTVRLKKYGHVCRMALGGLFSPPLHKWAEKTVLPPSL